MKKPLYRDHLFLVFILWVVFVMMDVLLYYLGIFKATYFAWGPNDNLDFLGVPIDTMEAWSAMVVIRIICVTSQTIVGTVVGPWITTVLQNPAVPVDEMDYSLRKSQLILNLYESVNLLNGLFSMWMIFTQVDLALIEAACIMFVLNAWTLRRWLEGKEDYQARRESNDHKEAIFLKEMLDLREVLDREEIIALKEILAAYRESRDQAAHEIPV